MYEIAPVLAGVLAGFVVWQLERPRMRVAALGALSLSLGVLVSAMSGDLMESWAFALLAAAQVILAGFVTMALLKRFGHSPIR